MNRHERRAAEAQQRRAQPRVEVMRYYLTSTTWTERCVPHLDDPELRRILHRDFGLFVISHYGSLKGDRMPGDFETWDNEMRPPWWQYVKDLACHYLVNVNLRLAMLAQPDRPWRIITSWLHSTVWDGGKSIFDMNYTGPNTTANEALLMAAGVMGSIPPGYQVWDYVEPLPVGEYMPVGIFFPSRDEAEWVQWEKGIEATPALRRALLKGLRRGHLAHVVNKPNYPRALKILNRTMARDLDTRMADEARSLIESRRLDAEVIVNPKALLDRSVEQYMRPENPPDRFALV
jgi:hypothetical protein